MNNMDIYRNMENICSKEKLTQDIDGAVLNFDEEYYDSSGINVLIMMFQQHYRNITTTTTTTIPPMLAQTQDDDNSISANTAPINPELELTREQLMFASLQEFLHNLDPRRDLALYNEMMLQNGLIVIAYLAIILVSLFGNLLVLFIILSRHHIRAQTTNKLIANLTVSDLLLTTFNIPLTVVRLLFDSWPLGSMLCHLGPLVQAQSVYVSTITMVVIALDRQQVLLGSLPKSLLSSTLTNVWTIGFIWLLSTVLSIPHFIFNRVVHKQTYTCVKRCQAIYPKPAQDYSKAITVFTVLSQYVVPLTIIVICYTQIGIHIWKRGHIGAMTRSQKFSHLQARKRTIKMLILVVIVFTICWLPLNLYHIYLDFVPNSNYSRTVFIFCHWFGISSVCYNPFIYFWLNKQYKERAKAILRMCFHWKMCLCWPGNNNSNSSNNNGNLPNRPDSDTMDSFWSVENVPNRSFRGNKQIFVMKNIKKTGTHTQKRYMYSEIIKISFDEEIPVKKSKLSS